ncbi:MFS transporter [Saccharopolyspora rhizosphaerae]|uniref:MFS transporter n=2 Tax=Saccharopolyspora rhizosphaerae TaxID=2492662 RepID=A0A3R8VCU8_9PSEU|nr:MFS transporter [Saccharopolyspora rhizosphaerae]
MRVVLMVMLLLIGIVNYVDRSTLAIANHSVQQDFGIGPAEMGLLLSVFSWAYAFAQLPAGGLLDRFGARRVLGGGLLLWSVAQAFCGLAANFKQMLLGRVVLGLGEAPAFPGGAKVVSQWWPRASRGFPVGLFNAASTIAPAIAPPLLTWLMLAYGWRTMFVVAGAVGIVLALVWFGVHRDRAPSTDEERPVPVSVREWAGLLRHRTTWGMVLGFTGVIYSIYLYLTWLPAYLESERGLSVADTGIALIVPYLAGTLGMLAGGGFGDLLVRRGVPTMLARKIPICTGLLVGGLCTIPVALTPSTTLALVCISLAQFFMNSASAGAWSLAATAGSERITASLGSLQNFGGYFGGAFAPLITGILVEETGSFVVALLAASGIAILAALSYAFLVAKPVGTPDLHEVAERTT